MYILHELASSYGSRPSDLLCIQDRWLAYEFDNAVFMYGRWVNNKRQETDKKGRPLYSIEDILSGKPNRTHGSILEAFAAQHGLTLE